jgi:hypothetical protein
LDAAIDHQDQNGIAQMHRIDVVARALVWRTIWSWCREELAPHAIQFKMAIAEPPLAIFVIPRDVGVVAVAAEESKRFGRRIGLGPSIGPITLALRTTVAPILDADDGFSGNHRFLDDANGIRRAVREAAHVLLATLLVIAESGGRRQTFWFFLWGWEKRT